MIAPASHTVEILARRWLCPVRCAAAKGNRRAGWRMVPMVPRCSPSSCPSPETNERKGSTVVYLRPVAIGRDKYSDQIDNALEPIQSFSIIATVSQGLSCLSEKIVCIPLSVSRIPNILHSAGSMHCRKAPGTGTLLSRTMQDREVRLLLAVF